MIKVVLPGANYFKRGNVRNMVKANHDKIKKIRGLNEYLQSSIKGQDHVINLISPFLCRGMLDLCDEDRPLANFLFLGPTGVGKTELTLQMSNYIYNSDENANNNTANLYRFDMSEFMHQDLVKNLIGDEKGNPGRLGKALKNTNGGVLLFDEIEKAHISIRDIFLQILDYGRVTLGDHNEYNVTKFFIVFTSNVGSGRISRAKDLPYETLKRAVVTELYNEFRPEFIGRFDEVVIFKPLNFAVQKEITKNMIVKEIKRINKKFKVSLTFDNSLTNHCQKQGINTISGARKLRSAVANSIQWAVGEGLISKHGVQENSQIIFDAKTSKTLLKGNN